MPATPISRSPAVPPFVAARAELDAAIEQFAETAMLHQSSLAGCCPLFWVAIGTLRGTLLINWNSRALVTLVQKLQPHLGTPSDLPAKPVTDMLWRVYSASGRLSTALAAAGY